MTARSELLPDVPTVGEAGLPGMEGTVPFGISVPLGTPASVVMRLNTAFNEALSDPPTRRRLIELGFVPVGGAPQAYSAMLASEIAKWRKVIKESNIPRSSWRECRAHAGTAGACPELAEGSRPLMHQRTAGVPPAHDSCS